MAENKMFTKQFSHNSRYEKYQKTTPLNSLSTWLNLYNIDVL